jgi:hypothetical protein
LSKLRKKVYVYEVIGSERKLIKVYESTVTAKTDLHMGYDSTIYKGKIYSNYPL